MNRPLVQLILCRIREFVREPAAIFWVYGFPIVLALILGTAFRNRPVESIKVDVVVSDEVRRPFEERRPSLTAVVGVAGELTSLDDPDHIPLRWAIKDPRLKVEPRTEWEALDRLRTAKTSLVVFPDPATPAKYRMVVDDNQPGSVLARAAVDTLVLREANPSAELPTAAPMADESGGRYIDFLMPGLIGMNLMGGGLFGVGFLIVDMRVRKLLKRYLATPMRKSDFMLSVMFSRLLFTITDVTILLAVAHLPFFGLRVHGNWLALLSFIFLGGMTFSGIGLIIASRAKTLETASGLMNAFMLPQWLASGVFFSSENFPSFVQPIIQALPLTALNNGLRAVINDGGGFAAILWPAVILVAWGGLSFALALKLFRWR